MKESVTSREEDAVVIENEFGVRERDEGTKWRKFKESDTTFHYPDWKKAESWEEVEREMK